MIEEIKRLEEALTASNIGGEGPPSTLLCDQYISLYMCVVIIFISYIF